MKTHRQLIITGIVLLMVASFSGCEDEIGSNSNEVAIPLVAEGGVNLKAPGKGQYRLAALSGSEVSISAIVPRDAQSLTITKTVNLEVDPTFGTNGVLTVDASSFDSEYNFVYAPPVTDIDQLVGFTFTAERPGGTLVSDLTLVVTLSPRDNIPFRRWNLVSRLWVDAGNAEDLKECEKDNYYLFNSDGTMSLNYGTVTGTGDCGLDGPTVYDTWQLTEDEQHFIMTRHGVFTPDVTETETYRVVKLTTDELVLDIDLDLSVFGLTAEETFRYFLEAAPEIDMKLGLGLYKQLLTDDNFRFARQAGATHIVAQLVDYVKGDDPSLTNNYLNGWGVTRNEGKLWSYEELKALKDRMASHGLTLAAIENFDPSHWYDVLLDGPKKRKQIEDIKTIIRNIGRAEIPVMGYYFSLAGVWGWTSGPMGRGGAGTVGYHEDKINKDEPIPNGMVWNMTYHPEDAEGVVGSVGREEMWSRLQYFLQEVLPVAEENGVRLVAHPDDPPVSSFRGTARLFYNTQEYEKLLSIHPSSANGFEFCMETIQEMQGSDVYDLLDRYSRSGHIGYIHFRNVTGKVPNYREAFVDEGDINMVRALKILRKNGYDGVLIPDHTPEMTCRGPWHAGMAYALGYMRGVIQTLDDA